MPPKGFTTPMSMSSQFVTNSGPPVKQSKEIFLLAQEGQRLGMTIAQKFANLSSQEALFHIGTQSTSYEKVASRCPDHLTAYYTIMCSEDEKVKDLNEAVDYLHKKTGQVWLETNSTLF